MIRSGARRWGLVAAAVVAGLGLTGSGAVADDIPVIGTKLSLGINTLSGKAKVTSVQKDPAIHYGGGGPNASLLDGTLEVYYADTPTNRATLTMPAPWLLDTGITARFKNALAPAGPTPVKAATLKAGRLAKLSARALGGIDISTAPGAGGVIAVFSITNGNDASVHRFCSRYSLGDSSVVQHRTSTSGYKLNLKRGVPIACPTCTDGAKNGLETGVDCGGGACPACGAGEGCATNADCASGVCAGNVCQAPACDDGVQNGGETDLDCGGPCAGCADGGSCGVGGDCASGVCAGNVCTPATCGDGVANGSETDVDCGGGSCPACAPGDACVGGLDCTSGVCTGSVCQAPLCTDLVQNGSETDVDCGGGACPDCDPGDACTTGGDCTSDVCSGGVCQVPLCHDGVRNGTETDVDCGGACPDCDPGETCATGGDCTSGVCTGGVCQAPACDDGVANGAETDVDCGGGSCPVCNDGQQCAVAADCTSGVCAGGVCQAPACDDGVANGAETDVDCGGPCPDCDPGEGCLAASDCTSGVCTGGVCQAPVCSDGVANGAETGVDCGGGVCPACPAGQGCNAGADCTSGVCIGNVCQAPTCLDGVENGTETDVDCGGGACPGCPNAFGCNAGSDCQSLVCSGGLCQAPTCSDGVQNGGELGVDCGGPCTVCSCQTRGQCRMFVSSITTGGNIGGLAGADIFCNARAAAAGLVGQYQAWLCDGVTAPAARSFHATVPYRRTDGALIANSWADLTDGAIASPINRTEFGTDVSGTAPFLPWTYVTTAGTCDNETYLSPGSGPCPAFSNCKTNCASNGGNAGWTSASGWVQGSKGDVNATGGNWTDGVTGLCSTPQERIYCIEQ